MFRHSLGLTVCMAVVLALTCRLEAHNSAYMFTGTDQFGTIDLDSGVFTQLGNTGVLFARLGVANGAIYGAAINGTTLYQVSPTDGRLTAVGNSNITFELLGSTAKWLYALDPDFNFYSVNPATARARKIGSAGVDIVCKTGGTGCGMSTNSKKLYVTVGADLYIFSTATGAARLVGNTSISNGIGAMVFEGGKLYAGSNTPFQIYTLNTSTGAATFVATPTGNPAPVQFWGLAPSVLLEIAPIKLTFAAQTVGTTSPAQTVTLTNNGFVAMKTSSIQAHGDFAQASTCGATLAPHAKCTISVTFTPTQTGTRVGSVKIKDTAGGSPQKVSLTGTGE
jgi:hypothetical protein